MASVLSEGGQGAEMASYVFLGVRRWLEVCVVEPVSAGDMITKSGTLGNGFRPLRRSRRQFTVMFTLSIIVEL